MQGTSAAGKGESRPPKAITLRRVWTDTAVGRVHARVGGETLDGLPVVLVHGMVISSRYMVPTALELASPRVPSLERTGHRKSWRCCSAWRWRQCPVQHPLDQSRRPVAWTRRA